MGPAIKAAAVVGLMVLAALPAARAEDYPVGTRDSIWSDPGTYMIGSFRHMGEIYPSRPVHRAGSVSELPQGTPLALASYDFTWTDLLVRRYINSLPWHGVPRTGLGHSGGTHRAEFRLVEAVVWSALPLQL